MKLLRVKATNYKNCVDDFTIDFVAKSKKTSEDKEYELNEIAEGLHIYSTAAIVGKNASGKTSAIELLDSCYSILGEFRLEDTNQCLNETELEICFYHEGIVYRYTTVLKADSIHGERVTFNEQHLYQKKYYKSKARDIYCEDGFEELTNLGELPEDTSIVFFVLKKNATHAVYFDCNGEGTNTYRLLFSAMKSFGVSAAILEKILKIFDSNISTLSMVDDKHYRLVYCDKVRELSDTELVHMLSSGTTKGVLLYVYVVAALQNGFDLLIDEIENHFHKTLVENIISLFKDKMVNRSSAGLVFTTHYCELLDLFNRQDNIWITRSVGKVHLDNMYEKYSLRPELIKSRQFYGDAFSTSVNYEDLMALKKELMMS